jgi:serine/threonine protein kinase
LYKTHLKELQSNVVPTLINVYSTIYGFEMAFVLPHPSFWVEATEDMPNLLKERVISAYETLHHKGVLHRNVELSNILIGADGYVTLINFEHSGTRGGHDGYQIPRVLPEAFEMEMRELKYKLDWESSKSKELRKRKQQNHMLNHNTKEKQKARASPGYRPQFLAPAPELIRNPPVGEGNWELWNAKQPRAKRFVVPGQDCETLR